MVSGPEEPGTYTASITKSGATASCTVTVEEPEPPPEIYPETYTVTYDANGGAGTMPADTAEQDTPFILLECGFAPPEGKKFAGWTIGGTTVQPIVCFTRIRV